MDQHTTGRSGSPRHIVVGGSGGCTEALRVLVAGVPSERDLVIVEHELMVAEVAPRATSVVVARAATVDDAVVSAAALDAVVVSPLTTLVVDDVGSIDRKTAGALGRLVDRALATEGAAVIVGNSAPDLAFTPPVLSRVLDAGGMAVAVGLVGDDLAAAMGFAQAPALDPGSGAAAIRLGPATVMVQLGDVPAAAR